MKLHLGVLQWEAALRGVNFAKHHASSWMWGEKCLNAAETSLNTKGLTSNNLATKMNYSFDKHFGWYFATGCIKYIPVLLLLGFLFHISELSWNAPFKYVETLWGTFQSVFHQTPPKMGQCTWILKSEMTFCYVRQCLASSISLYRLYEYYIWYV